MSGIASEAVRGLGQTGASRKRLPVSRKKIRFWSGVLCLIGVLAIGWLTWPRERLLLERAVRVTDAHDWSVDRGPDVCIAYGWLSDQDVFFCQAGFLSESPLCQRNVQTGVQTFLKSLSACFRKTAGDPDGVAVSPDANWVLWYGGGAAIVCASLVGSSCRRFPWPVRGYGSFHWSGDAGAQWIEFAGKNIDRPGPLVRLTMRDPSHPA